MVRPATGPGQPLAWVVRGGLAESVHTGHLVVLDGDRELCVLGDPDAPLFARSSLKPLQMVAMLLTGVKLTDEQIALGCGSHAGSPAHVQVARDLLTAAGLTEADLQNTPDWPRSSAERTALVEAGLGRSSLIQNCSGKHAAMLATCVASGWDTASYRELAHPLQRLIGQVVAELTGSVAPVPATVDGCGAPLFATTLRGLARAFTAIVDAEPGTPQARVADAMRAHPELVFGAGTLDTEAMVDVPGLLFKGGAEGIIAAALPGGRAIMAKIADGSARPAPTITAAALRLLGIEPGSEQWAWEPVPVLGHGEPVGQLLPAFGAQAMV